MKRILVLSGGGSKGSFQAGALWHLMYTLERQYDAVVGISVGAINALRIAQFSPVDHKEAAVALRDDWHSISTDQVLKSWAPVIGPIIGFFKGSLKNNAPLRKFLEERVQVQAIMESGCLLKVGATNMRTYDIEYFDQFGAVDPITAAMASSAFPGQMPPERVNGDLYLDGGIRDITPVYEAIKLGATHVDVISTGPLESEEDGYTGGNMLTLLQDILNVMSNEVSSNDIKLARLVNEILRLRSYAPADVLATLPDRSGQRDVVITHIHPAKKLMDAPLDFDTEKMKELWAIGKARAEELVPNDDNH